MPRSLQPPSLHRIGPALGALALTAVSALAWAAPPAKGAPPAPKAPPEPSMFEQVQRALLDYMQSDGAKTAWQVVITVLVLLGGWIVAKFISWAVYRLLLRTTIDNVIAERLGLDLLFDNKEDAKKAMEQHALERGIANVLFWILMLLVVVGALQVAGLDKAAGPLERLVDDVVRALPKIGKAGLILAVAYGAATILRRLVIMVVERSRIDERVAELSTPEEAAKKAADKEADKPQHLLSETAGQVVFWLLMTVGLAGAFDALQIDAISGPLRGAVERIVGVLPSLGVAAVLVAAGWILGRVLRAITTKLLGSVGFDRLTERVHIDGIFGELRASGFVGLLLQVFIVVQAVLAALNELGLRTLSEPLTDVMTRFWNLLPAFAVSVLMIVAGVLVGRLLRGFAAATLRNIGFDRLMTRIGVEKLAEREDKLGEPSELAGFIVQVVVVMVALAQSLQNLSLVTWAGYVDSFLQFGVQRALVALGIVGLGFFIGNYVRDVITARQAASTGASGPRWMGEFVRYTVLVFAFTMAIHQIGVAENFVLLTFALLFGSLCLAAALAFGLGAREIAGEVVRQRWDEVKRESGGAGPGGGGPRPGASASSMPIERPASTGVITPPSILDRPKT